MLVFLLCCSQVNASGNRPGYSGRSTQNDFTLAMNE
jgi:hypothetical protein